MSSKCADGKGLRDASNRASVEGCVLLPIAPAVEGCVASNRASVEGCVSLPIAPAVEGCVASNCAHGGGLRVASNRAGGGGLRDASNRAGGGGLRDTSNFAEGGLETIRALGILMGLESSILTGAIVLFFLDDTFSMSTAMDDVVLALPLAFMVARTGNISRRLRVPCLLGLFFLFPRHMTDNGGSDCSSVVARCAWGWGMRDDDKAVQWLSENLSRCSQGWGNEK